MRKLFPLLICLWCCCAVSTYAQLTPMETREAEWKAYALPQTNFTRQKSADNKVAFRIPADWKQEGTTLTFVGPRLATIRVYVQEIPDGYPLQDYVTSFLQAVRDNAGTPEATLTRKTQIQDLEAREIFLEQTNVEGDQVRSVFWITVNGPLALSFTFTAPITHATELEPFFKAVVQSVVFLPRQPGVFENLRTSALKPGASGPIHELESIVASLDELGVDREPAINRLASLYASQPDAAIDLLVDRRPIVRNAAVHALVRSNNNSLSPFLWERVDDSDPLVDEAAARVIATRAGVIDEIIERSMFGHRVEVIARIWPFMSKDKRLDLLQRIFSQTAERPGPPPPAAGKPGVTVSAKELRAVKPGELPVPVVKKFSNDPNVQIGALTLLIDVPVEQFKLPLERIIASNNDELIATALQLAYIRGETLAVEPLLKLVKSSDRHVSWFAAQCLGFSAGISDIARIEALISKDADYGLKTAIKEIRFRQELSNAKSAKEQRELIGKAFADAAFADFAWRYDCEATVAGCTPTTTSKRDLTVKPFAENLFPKKVRHYIAIPKP